jgi:hypothetical protein
MSDCVQNLKGSLKMIEACDVIRNKAFNVSERQRFTTTQKIDFLLQKLSQYSDDHTQLYKVRPQRSNPSNCQIINIVSCSTS